MSCPIDAVDSATAEHRGCAPVPFGCSVHGPRFPGLPQPGTRLRLLGTTDIFTRLQPGEEGTVSHVDSIGTVHVNWDSGSNLGLVFGEDRWEVIT